MKKARCTKVESNFHFLPNFQEFSECILCLNNLPEFQLDMPPTQKKGAPPILYRHPYSKHGLYYANMAKLGIPLSIEAHGMLLTKKNRTLQPAATQCPNARPSGPAVGAFRPVLFAAAKLTLSTKRHCPQWWVLHENAFAKEKTNNHQLSK